MRIILFDLDGTLVDTGGSGRRAVTAAFAEVYGHPDAFRGIPFSGRTDPAILRLATRAVLGREPAPDEEERYDALYLANLATEVEASPGYRVLPGVATVVAGLSARPDCAIGLCTGNLAASAKTKLRRGGLDAFFAFGGYGSDSGDRAELTRLAAERGRAFAGDAGARASVLVVGDSPLDAAAARANGFPMALVATGWTSPEDLLAESPDMFFHDFSDWRASVARLAGIGDTIAATCSDLDRAVAVVAAGGVLVYPTSTLYGIGGDALEPAVAARVRRIKGGREAPFIVLAGRADQALAFAAEVPDAARRLATVFWPGPLTLALPAAAGVPGHLTGPDGTVAVRVDPHPFAAALASARPVISTSANRSGGPAPDRAEAVPDDVAAACDLFVEDMGPLGGRPSTLVRVAGAGVEVLREGAVSAEAISGALS